jgi:DNA-directed RNA polymerase specialized sigma24 family protein
MRGVFVGKRERERPLRHLRVCASLRPVAARARSVMHGPEDIAQDAVLVFLRASAREPEITNPEAFVATTIRWLHRNAIRDGGRRRHRRDEAGSTELPSRGLDAAWSESCRLSSLRDALPAHARPVLDSLLQPAPSELGQGSAASRKRRSRLRRMVPKSCFVSHSGESADTGNGPARASLRATSCRFASGR